MIALEVKLDEGYNPALRGDYNRDAGGPDRLGPVTDATNLTDNQKKLIFQMMRYAVLGQFGTLPYRHLFFVTITGRKLRIWKFSPTGCLVTDTIDYLNDVQCKPFVRFLHAIGSGPLSHLGVDVGPQMMFREISDHPKSDKVQRRMEAVKKLYCHHSKDFHWEKHLPTEPGYWLFRLSLPSKQSYNRGINSDDTSQTGQSSQTSNVDNTTLVVFRRPIFRANHIFSRATRCYLGIELEFLLSPEFEKASPVEKLKKMHTLKTAWQFVSRTPEVEFHRLFAERHAARGTNGTDDDGIGEPSRVATVLAGGIVSDSCQFRGRPYGNYINDVISGSHSQSIQVDPQGSGKQTSQWELEKPNGKAANGKQNGLLSKLAASIRSRRPPGITEDEIHVKQEYLDALTAPPQDPDHQARDEKSQPRELHWLVYQEVGGKLGAVVTVKEFAQVMMDILHGTRFSSLLSFPSLFPFSDS